MASLPTPLSQTSSEINQTPRVKSQAQPAHPAITPNQSSPTKTTPSKPTLKALPTVRDHTSDQLNPEGDEYIPREYDDAGEGKVDVNGYLQGGREYKIRTFTLPGRAEKLFMLATECARTLQYRDSYLLFNKNRSLFKIIAQPKEKEELVAHDILPYSYRSRQIAIVTARSMFRQFGSRVIKDGRRVRDDYWEAKARKQGFTEEDAAGEKRPGAARAREAAMEAAQAGRQLNAYGDIVYSNGPPFGAVQPPNFPPGLTSSMAQFPTIDAYDAKYRDIPRPRQELTGPAYSDVTRPTTDTELAGQASHAAEYSKNINAQGRYRKAIVEEYWHRPHDPPVSTPQPQTAEPATTNQPFTSPRFVGNDLPSQQTSILSQQTPIQGSMNPPSLMHQQNPIQSPIRQNSMSQNFPRDASQFTPQHAQFNRSSSNLSISQTPGQQALPFGGAAYSPHGMNPQQHQQQSWGGPPPQPHHSPALHRMTTPQFSPNLAQGQIPSPMTAGGSHQSQSPHPQQMQPPQMSMLHHQNQGGLGGQQLFGPGAGLQAMNAAGFAGMGMPNQRAMYGMAQGGAGQFLPQQGGQQGQQHGQNWAGSPQNQTQGGQNWQGFQ